MSNGEHREPTRPTGRLEFSVAETENSGNGQKHTHAETFLQCLNAVRNVIWSRQRVMLRVRVTLPALRVSQPVFFPQLPGHQVCTLTLLCFCASVCKDTVLRERMQEREARTSPAAGAVLLR